MHPELLHHSTTRAPDSGLKLGFVDAPPEPLHSIASAQNTPSKARMNTPANLSSTSFDFKFGSESQLSNEAQKLMDNVREEAARIKAQMQAEKEAQQQKDDEAEAAFNGINASGRKIAQPKGKAGRFSDVHMAQFKKMDSIANHPSAYRARPGFAQPTVQSLKRSGSKAGLDEHDRPRTSGKGTPGQVPPPFLGRPTSVSPFKSIPAQPERLENTAPAKRARHSELHDVSSSRPSEPLQSARPVTMPKPVSSRLLSPTKASLARTTTSQIPIASPNKAPGLTRTTSVKSLRSMATVPEARPATAHAGVATQSPSKLPSAKSFGLDRPLPALPKEDSTFSRREPASPQRAKSAAASLSAFASNQNFSSRLPKFAGLKSILRSGRKAEAAMPNQETNGTPKRSNSDSATSGNGSVKKVDFTPSVKSRYAVKLAAGSPSPAKLPHVTPGKAPSVPYDPAAYTFQGDDGDDVDGDEENWEDAESEIDYPTLPEATSSPSEAKDEAMFYAKAKNHNRRESTEFKSIFTTLHPSRPAGPSTLTSVNTMMNQTDPTVHANRVMRSPSNVNFSVPSPSTIRRVRSSGVTDTVQPFEDTEVKTVPHGLPGKKRRRESTVSADSDSNAEEAKENRRISVMPAVPGGWQDSSSIESPDEGAKRGGKRTRVDKAEQPAKVEPKKPRQSSAREMAKNNAKERKNRGILSLSRLNMLSRPKQRA